MLHENTVLSFAAICSGGAASDCYGNGSSKKKSEHLNGSLIEDAILHMIFSDYQDTHPFSNEGYGFNKLDDSRVPLEATMNTQASAQSELDNRLPSPVSESDREIARQNWLYDASEQLAKGGDVSFQRRSRSPQGITADQFALVIDEHVNGRLADCKVDTPSLGWLMIDAWNGCRRPTSVEELLGISTHPHGMLGEIAENLLKPLADDALIAIDEDNEL
ncbi:hypothetical protein PBOI14_48990 [Pseudomonas sp. Boi14]|nr:hypothetical protein PBOI14_48990 [Pseudomonas sp. Boi14]